MTGKPLRRRRRWRGELHEAVADIVSKQGALGIDVVSDGELSKTSFQYYVTDRLSGLEPFTPKPGVRKTRENHGVSRPSTRTARIPARSRPATPAPARSAICRARSSSQTDHRRTSRPALKGIEPGRRVHAVGVAVELRRPDGEPLLQDRRGAPLRGRRGAARGIPGHRRGGLHGADRRSAARHALHAQSRR